MLEKKEIIVIDEEPLVVLLTDDSQNNEDRTLLWKNDFLKMEVGDKIESEYNHSYRVDYDEELECIYISENEEEKEVYCNLKHITHCYKGSSFEKEDDDKIVEEFLCVKVKK